MTVLTVAWRKSSYSGGNNGDCVEMACGPAVRAIRDSKNPAGGALLVEQAAAFGFLAAVKAGKFDV